MFFGSVQKISRLDSQSKFQMFTLFTGRHIGGPRRSSDMTARYYKLYNSARNISTNTLTLGQRTHLKLGEVSFFIVYNITVSWLYPLHGFWFYCYCLTTHILFLRKWIPLCFVYRKLKFLYINNVLGSISAALSCQMYPPREERGLISRTAADRA